MERTLSKHVDDTKLLGVDDTLRDRAAMEESHQSCYISILTTVVYLSLDSRVNCNLDLLTTFYSAAEDENLPSTQQSILQYSI